MNPDLSNEEHVRTMVDQLGMSEERVRFYLDIERGRIDGDTEVVDGPLTAADRRRLGIGSIFDASPGDGGGVPREHSRSLRARSSIRSGHAIIRAMQT